MMVHHHHQAFSKLVQLLLAVHLLAGHADPALPPNGPTMGPYALSPLRGGRHDGPAVSSVETTRAVLRSSARLQQQATEPSLAAPPGKGTSKKGRARAGTAAVPPAKEVTHEMPCAIESPFFFGAGRMKKWRGCCTSADDLLAQLVRHFGLDDATAAGSGEHGSVLLQFHDSELMEYIDLEDSSWQDFRTQVLTLASPPRPLSRSLSQNTPPLLSFRPIALSLSLTLPLSSWPFNISIKFLACCAPFSHLLARLLARECVRVRTRMLSLSCRFLVVSFTLSRSFPLPPPPSCSVSVSHTYTCNTHRPLSKSASCLARLPDVKYPGRQQRQRRTKKRARWRIRPKRLTPVHAEKFPARLLCSSSSSSSWVAHYGAQLGRARKNR